MTYSNSLIKGRQGAPKAARVIIVGRLVSRIATSDISFLLLATSNGDLSFIFRNKQPALTIIYKAGRNDSFIQTQ